MQDHGLSYRMVCICSGMCSAVSGVQSPASRAAAPSCCRHDPPSVCNSWRCSRQQPTQHLPSRARPVGRGPAVGGGPTIGGAPAVSGACPTSGARAAGGAAAVGGRRPLWLAAGDLHSQQKKQSKGMGGKRVESRQYKRRASAHPGVPSWGVSSGAELAARAAASPTLFLRCAAAAAGAIMSCMVLELKKTCGRAGRRDLKPCGTGCTCVK